MHLKPLDLLVTLELATGPKGIRTYADLAQTVGLSASEAHQAVQRATKAGLLRPAERREEKPLPQVNALLKFLEHGVRHAFYMVPGRIVRGVPTAHNAPPLDAMVQSGDEPPLVWPSADGTVRGRAVEPLYRTVPQIAVRNPHLYETLALVDALRCGATRERKLAMKLLEQRIGGAVDDVV